MIDIDKLSEQLTPEGAAIRALLAEVRAWRTWADEQASGFNDGCGCCSSNKASDDIKEDDIINKAQANVKAYFTGV
jgi:hypothetical protein